MKDCKTYYCQLGNPQQDPQDYNILPTEDEHDHEVASRGTLLSTGDGTMDYGALTHGCLKNHLLSIEEGVESSRTKSAPELVLDDDATTHTLAFTVSRKDEVDNQLDRLQNTRKKGSRQHYYPLFAFAYLCCFGFAVLGLSQQQRAQQANNADGTMSGKWALSDLFIFDELFGGGYKKRPSAASLESPPAFSRSLLLVLRAEVTPVNRIVDDIDRQLTAKGMQDAVGLGLYLKQHNIPEPDWIFSSPSERTAFTTELIRRHWASNAPVAFEDILYTLEFNDYFSFVAGLNDNFQRVMIVGHNPAILNTAKKLMKTHGIEDFPDSGFMEIRWDNLALWHTVVPFSGSTKMAVDPHNNFLFTSVQN